MQRTAKRMDMFLALLGLASSFWLLFFCYLMLCIIWPYTSGRTDIDFLLTKQHIIHLAHYRWAFYLHIFSSWYVLTAGLVQFPKYMLQSCPKLHRAVGKGYVFIILFISGPAAFCMSLYGNGGWLARASFLILSVLWWWTTYKAYRSIRQGRVVEHRNFMIRSYALTLSAISLRIYQFLLGYYTDLSPIDAYLLVAWVSWVGNLLVAEVIIYQRRKLILVH